MHFETLSVRRAKLTITVENHPYNISSKSEFIWFHSF